MTPKNAAAVALGRRGGKARVANQTAEQRAESARRAAEARWAQEKEKLESTVERINSGMKELQKANRRSKKKAEKSPDPRKFPTRS